MHTPPLLYPYLLCLLSSTLLSYASTLAPPLLFLSYYSTLVPPLNASFLMGWGKRMVGSAGGGGPGYAVLMCVLGGGVQVGGRPGVWVCGGFCGHGMPVGMAMGFEVAGPSFSVSSLSLSLSLSLSFYLCVFRWVCHASKLHLGVSVSL